MEDVSNISDQKPQSYEFFSLWTEISAKSKHQVGATPRRRSFERRVQDAKVVGVQHL
jgi:hypothetical protein